MRFGFAHPSPADFLRHAQTVQVDRLPTLQHFSCPVASRPLCFPLPVSPLHFPPTLSEVPSQGTSCFLQLLQWSSERVGAERSDIAPKVEAVWKKNILISTYLKNIIRNWKKKQSLFCFAFSPLLSKFRGLWLPITQDAMLKGRPQPIKTFKPGPYLFMNGTPLHSSFACFCFALKKDNLADI